MPFTLICGCLHGHSILLVAFELHWCPRLASYPVFTASFFLHVGKKALFSNMQKKLAVETASPRL